MMDTSLGLSLDACDLHHRCNIPSDQYHRHESKDSLIGLGVIAAGVPLYFLYFAKNRLLFNSMMN
ncbi:MAG: hypothetical protein R2877_08405 [Bdellovibrionota bacterium]